MNELLAGAALMLGAALLFVIIFRRAGLGATLGYIVGGAVIGPPFFNLVGEAATIQSVAEIGIALLLFIIGLELRPSRLWRLRRDIFGLGLLQVATAGVVLASLIHWTLDISWPASLALGLPLGLSSTAQVLPMLRTTGELNTPYGERAFSVLLFQDLSVIPMITIIAAMSRVPDPAAPPGWQLALFTVLAVAGLMLAGRYILNPLFRLIGRFNERELFVVAGLFAVIASAELMHFLHLSVALGAFVAGVMLAESPYRHELESDVEPFRSILLGLFFMSVGMLLDLSVIASEPLMVVALAAMIIVVKAALLYPLARWFGMRPGRAISIALLLSQAGEFGFVLFAQAAQGRLITPEAASLFGAVVTLSMVATPFLMKLIDWLKQRRPDEESGLEGPEFSPETNAIVVGYGRFGQTVAQMLYAKRIPVTLIDSNTRQIERVGEFGHKVYYGDGTRIDLLRTAGAETAEAILFCHDDRTFGRDKVEAVLEAFPQARVMVRVFDRRDEIALSGLDLELVQREVFESAVAMGVAALHALQIANREVGRVEQEYRLRDGERLRAQTESGGDLHAGADRSFAVDRPLPDAPQKR